MVIFDCMKQPGSTPYPIACRWISWLVVLLFAGYWFMTLGLAFFKTQLSSVAPHQSFLYQTFCRQDWHLFAATKLYNRQMNVIIRSKQIPVLADTIDLEQYLLAKKREHAPFSNYQEAMEKILHGTMNEVEIQVNQQKAVAKKQFPGRSEDFYVQQASGMVMADSLNQQAIKNIVVFAKDMLTTEKMDTAGKEYQLSIRHKYIPPPKSKGPLVGEDKVQTVFISAYKSF
jgi:hypothetical protein